MYGHIMVSRQDSCPYGAYNLMERKREWSSEHTHKHANASCNMVYEVKKKKLLRKRDQGDILKSGI